MPRRGGSDVIGGGGGSDSIGGPGGGPAAGVGDRGNRSTRGGATIARRSSVINIPGPNPQAGDGRGRRVGDQNLLDKGTQAPAPVDPAPQTAEQISARQAEVRRAGRGGTILSGRLGEAAGPSISRKTLGGL